MSGKNPSEDLNDPAYETALTVVSDQDSGGESSPDGADVPGTAAPAPAESGGDPASGKTEMTILMDGAPSSRAPGGAGADVLQPGDHIDRYTVVRKLGQGGMGSVYLVRHEKLGVFRAAKVLASALYLRGGEFVDRFIREARLACSISNPNIVNVLDVGEDRSRGLCWLIMEYVDGGTLRDVLRKIPKLSEVHTILIAEAVAGALAAAAQQKIVHRDIKPDNIMLTRRGEVKLADLGIAKNNEENVQLTKSHVMMGTPAYLAPEQAMDAHSVDVRADIYSLGATMYEMLTGAIPYPGKSTYDIMAKLVSSPVPDPRALTDTVSSQTARLVMRMLAKEAKHRPATPEILLREIRALNILPPELDPSASIRELLESSGTGNYSPAASTSVTGDPVSVRLIRSVFLKCATLLRRIPIPAGLMEFFRRKPVFFYILLAAVTLLAVGLPLALSRGEGKTLRADGAVPVLAPGTETPEEKASVPAVVTTPEKKPAVPLPKAEAPVEKSPAPAAVTPPEKKPAVSLPKAEAPVEKSPAPVAVTPPEKKPAVSLPKTEAPAEKSPAPAAVTTPEKQVSVPVPEPKVPKKDPTPSTKAETPAREAVPVPVIPRRSPPPAPPAPKEAAKAVFLAEISPAGANVVLRSETGRRIAAGTVPENGRLKFTVPEGQYRLQASAPGYKSGEREFAISQSRTITGVKLILLPDTRHCTVAFYGNAKLLAFLRNEGVEVRIDSGVWKKVKEFPLHAEISRRPHTVFLRARGIVPQEQKVEFQPEQKRCAVEFYLTEKDAAVEFETAVKEPVFINFAGIWEPLRKRVMLPPFRETAVKWRAGKDGEEQTVILPELMPESFQKIRLISKKKTALPGEKEIDEANALIGKERYKEAIEKLQAAEKLKHPGAFYLLGLLAEQGKGRWFASDGDALVFYRKAAEAPFNDPRAQYRMGVFTENGRGGLERDMAGAIVWYRKAAAGKNPEALYRMGMVYKNGEGREPVDYARMIRFLTDAAEAGQPDAQFQLGYCCENGIGVPLSVEKAKHWYAKAAAQGHEKARIRGGALGEIKE